MPSTGQKLIRPCLEITPLKEVYDRIFPAPKINVNNTPTDEQRPSTEDIDLSTYSHRNTYFYLHRHRAATNDIVLVPVKPSATLREVLRGRSVLEFPTIYILDDDLSRLEGGPKSAEVNVSTSTSVHKRKFVLEELYLKDHPDEAESDDGDEEEEDEEEDYTSSEGSSSYVSSDNENEDEDEDGHDYGSEPEAGKAPSVKRPGSADQEVALRSSIK